MSISKYNHPLAENIAQIIKAKGIKQSSVAERAGIGYQAFSDMLNGRKVIKACDIPIIAKSLEITPNELFGIVGQHERAG